MLCCVVFFFFKQKTAYEMRISDWSSDVCSSDLDAEAVHTQFDRVIHALAEKLPTVAEHLEEARADILAFTAFPKEIWRQIWSNNPNERLTREIRRRPDVVGLFHILASIIRLVSAVLATQHTERAAGTPTHELSIPHPPQSDPTPHH